MKKKMKEQVDCGLGFLPIEGSPQGTRNIFASLKDVVVLYCCAMWSDGLMIPSL